MRTETYHPRKNLDGVPEKNKTQYVEINGFWVKSFFGRRLRAAESQLKELNEKRLNIVDMAAVMKLSETAIKRYCEVLGIVIHNRRQYLKPFYKWTPKEQRSKKST